MRGIRLIACLAALCVTMSLSGSLWAGGVPVAGSEDRIWVFNFAPESAPDAQAFAKVTGKTVYNKETGYGWVDLKGELKAAEWEGGKEVGAYEVCDNLNLVCRPGPDALGCSYASGPATFALDLKPGMYDVWVLSGDWGMLEYVPHEPYQIKVENTVAYDFRPTAAQAYQRFDDFDGDDVLTDLEVYRTHVKPRFEWKKVTVGVYDGQLSVTVAGTPRDDSILKYVGNYAITETVFGPHPRFPGAINAMMVAPATQQPGFGQGRLDMIETWRREDFRRKYPRMVTEPGPPPELTQADKTRGYTVYFPPLSMPARPETVMPNDEKTLKLRVTPGEVVPITFAVCPLKDLGRTQVLTGYLRGPAGALIPPTDLRVGVVRYVAKQSGRAPQGVTLQWRPAPEMVVPTNAWGIRKDIAKQFWVTLSVPENAKPGTYEGSMTLLPSLAVPRTVKLEVEVLPFKLARPTDLSTGVTYFTPAQDVFFGDADRFWKRVQAEFADMRRHHMTTVQLTGMGLDNYDGLGKLLEAYRKAGFEQPVALLECYSPYYLVERRYGLTKGTPEYFEKYTQMFRDLLAEAKKRNWPPIICNFGDEFTNSASEELGAELAKHLRTIPGIVTSTDSNGYKEVTLMAPNVNIVAFNGGWDGPQGVNRGKKLLQASTVELIKNAGATPWLVNIGKDRFSNGLYFWKMAQLGVRGRIEWIYRSYDGMPHNFFDAKGPREMLAYPGPNFTVIPSLRWEWMRVGLDDLAYLVTLQKSVEAAGNDPAKAQAVAEAQTFIKSLTEAVSDDRSENRGAGWNDQRQDDLRNQAIDLILKLKAVK